VQAHYLAERLNTVPLVWQNGLTPFCWNVRGSCRKAVEVDLSDDARAGERSWTPVECQRMVNNHPPTQV